MSRLFKPKILVWLCVLFGSIFALVSIYQIFHKPCCDVVGYQKLARHFSEGGFFQKFPDLDRRTYLYATLLVPMIFLSDFLPMSFSTLVGFLQVGLFAGVIYFIRRYAFFKNQKIQPILVAALLFNFFIYPYLTISMTEGMVGPLTFLVLVFAVRFLDSGGESFKDLCWTCFISSILMMIRPANIYLAPVAAFLFFLYLKTGWSHRSNLDWVKQITGLMVVVGLPFIPQIMQNYIVFDKVTLFSAFDLGSAQVSWGKKYIKYGTMMINGGMSMPYHNPFYDVAADTTYDVRWYGDFLGRGLGTVFGHLFAALDVESLFPYQYNLNPFYRWPLAFIGHVYSVSIILGSALILRGRIVLFQAKGSAQFVVMTSIFIFAWAATIALTAAETRFGLPVFVLSSLYFWILVVNFNQLRHVRFPEVAVGLIFLVAALGYGVLFDHLKFKFIQSIGG